MNTLFEGRCRRFIFFQRRGGAVWLVWLADAEAPFDLGLE